MSFNIVKRLLQLMPDLGTDIILGQADQPRSCDDARGRLREAHSVRARARKVLQEASAAAQRVRAIIDAAETANERARAAADDLAAATRTWAEGGAVGKPNDAAQLAAARETAQAAYVARTRAEGAASGLDACETREQEARYGLKRAEEAVTDAALAVVLLEKGEPLLRKLEQSSAEFLADLAALEPLRILIHPRWASIHEFGPYKAPQCVQRLRTAANVRVESEEAFTQRMPQSDLSAARQWRGLVQRLCEDPNATID